MLGYGLDVSHPLHKVREVMGEGLEKKSRGKLNLEIYLNQQSGSERQCLELYTSLQQ